MKSGLVLASGALALSLVSASAQADGMAERSGWYAGLFAGAAWSSDFGPFDHYSTDVGFDVGGVLGKQITENVRGELEVSNWTSNADCSGGKCGVASLDVGALSILGNAWVDIPAGAVTPYAGGGIGMAGVKLDGPGVSDTSWGFAWQLGAGFRMNIAPNTLVDVGYRYKSSRADKGDIPFLDESFNATASVVQAGVTFRF